MAETHLQMIQCTCAAIGMDNPEGHAALKELLEPDFVAIDPYGLPYAGGPKAWWRVLRRIPCRR